MGDGPGLACPGCGSPDVDLRRGLLCATCAAAVAKLAEIRERAEAWAALAPADDWGLTPADTVAADCGRAILAITGTDKEASDG